MNPPDSFCIIPWISIQARPDGRMAACCFMKTPYQSSDGEDLHLSSSTLSAGFHSKSANELRTNLLAGIKDKNCSICWAEEALGQKSKRQFELSGYETEAQEILDGKYELKQPIFLDISPGDTCNLKCRICNASTSSMWRQEAVDLKLHINSLPKSAVIESRVSKNGKEILFSNWSKTNDSFWHELEQWLPRIKKFNFVGGEPFLSKAHFELLTKAVLGGYSKYQKIQYNTNGTVYPEEQFCSIFSQFQYVQIWVSLDGVGKRFEYQRYGASWDQVLSNFENFRSHQFIDLAICLTVSAINIYYLFESLDFWLDRGVKVYLGNVIGDSLNARCLPRQAKEKILERFTKTDIKKYDAILINRLEPFFEVLKTEEDFENWRNFCSSIKLHDQYRQEHYALTFPEAAQIYGMY